MTKHIYNLGDNFMEPLRFTNLYFLISAGNKMHSLVKKSSLVGAGASWNRPL